MKPCEYSYACFKTKQQTVRHRYLPRWSFDGQATTIAGAALSTQFAQAINSVTMTIANTPIDGGPVTIGIIQVGSSDVVYPLNLLTWDNLNTVPWSVSMSDIHLNLGGDMVLPIIPMPHTAVGVVYRATIWLDSEPSNIVTYTGQYTLPGVTP